jgi:hypothetical protein
MRVTPWTDYTSDTILAEGRFAVAALGLVAGLMVSMLGCGGSPLRAGQTSVPDATVGSNGAPDARLGPAVDLASGTPEVGSVDGRAPLDVLESANPQRQHDDATTAASNPDLVGGPKDAQAEGSAQPKSPLAVETDFLVISSKLILELTFGGKTVASRPTGLAVGEAVRGAALSGRQMLFLLVEAPYSGNTRLRALDLVAGTVTDRAYPGMTLPGLVGLGGVTVQAPFAWVVDGATANDGAPEGLVRFNLDDGTVLRVPTPENNRYSVDVTWGMDLQLHSLTSGLLLTTYDAYTMDLLGQTHLTYPESGVPIRGVAVDSSGRVFAAAEHGQLMRFSADGALEATIRSSAYYLHDVDLDGRSHVVASGSDGIVVITTPDLTPVLTVNTDTSDDVEVVIVPP